MRKRNKQFYFFFKSFFNRILKEIAEEYDFYNGYLAQMTGMDMVHTVQEL